jgi:hypothetical protein
VVTVILSWETLPCGIVEFLCCANVSEMAASVPVATAVPKLRLRFYFGILRPVALTLSRLFEEQPLATTI